MQINHSFFIWNLFRTEFTHSQTFWLIFWSFITNIAPIYGNVEQNKQPLDDRVIIEFIVLLETNGFVYSQINRTRDKYIWFLWKSLIKELSESLSGIPYS